MPLTTPSPADLTPEHLMFLQVDLGSTPRPVRPSVSTPRPCGECAAPAALSAGATLGRTPPDSGCIENGVQKLTKGLDIRRAPRSSDGYKVANFVQ